MAEGIVMGAADDSPVFHGARKPEMFAHPNAGHSGGDF